MRVQSACSHTRRHDRAFLAAIYLRPRIFISDRRFLEHFWRLWAILARLEGILKISNHCKHFDYTFVSIKHF